ncbi:hypothetical protein AVEN_119354-1 [Araneus ventricosus]|uniref:Uncharacterized protein n=1 Tax=Araneus ventricosus TaxID=182803 RepID=A0A4Y2PZJ7_ARAVE|nr:hypothetical protein AVEN_119354-1 [Araneus ventricosus]
MFIAIGGVINTSRCRPLRGTSSLGVTGFTTPRYPSVWSPSVFSSPSVYCFFFFPSRVGEGALHEKLLPLCLLPASHGQQHTPTCWPCVATHSTGGTFRSPVYQSAGIKRRGHSLGLALRVVTVPGGDSERIGSG